MALTKLRICIIFELISFMSYSGSSSALGLFCESDECGLVLGGERDLEPWLSLDLPDLRTSGDDTAFVGMAVISSRTSMTSSRSSLFASNDLMKIDFCDYEGAQDMHTI